MTVRWPRLFLALSLLSVLMAIASLDAGHVASTRGVYSVPRTPWGDPDLQGAYTNSAERLTPMERPDSFAGRKLSDITTAELTRLNKKRLATSAPNEPGFHDSVDGTPWSSRAWLILDPDDGKIPSLTANAKSRMSARADARRRRGAADSWTDFDLFSRCITRGVPNSMMPVIYGNTYEIVQAPGSVAIMHEMIHDTRVIPLDERPHVGPMVRSYLGDSRGYFDGLDLVIETTNFSSETSFLGSSQNLQLTERITPISDDILEWRVTVFDPETWTRPWTFAMNLTRSNARPLEYACHEGNYFLRHALSAEPRTEQSNEFASNVVNRR
jgi:hypothetical protein